MRNRIAIYLLCILCNLLFGFGQEVSDGNGNTNEKNPILLAISFPDPIHFRMMMYIVDMYKDRYTIYIGMFDSGICCLHENLSKYEIVHLGNFPMNDDQLATILRSSYHTSSLQDYYQNHVFEIGELSLNELYSMTNRQIEEIKPSLILSDFYLPGIHLSSISHSIPSIVFSVDSLMDFYPSDITITDNKRFFEVSLAVDQISHYIRNFIYSMNITQSFSFLYSSPIFVFSGFSSLFPSSKPTLPFFIDSIPSSWIDLPPVSFTGTAKSSLQTSLISFFDNPHITTHVVIYTGNHAGFESWQIRTILGGLQDPSVNVVILGRLSALKPKTRGNVFYASEKQVSLFYLLASFPISVIISYCDHAIVENSLYYQIPIVCIPSLKNKLIVETLVEQKLGVSFPEGFWTESTVRDCVKQITNLLPFFIDKKGWNQLSSEDFVDYGVMVYKPEEDNHIESYLNHIILLVIILLFVLQIVNRIQQVIRSSNHVKRY